MTALGFCRLWRGQMIVPKKGLVEPLVQDEVSRSARCSVKVLALLAALVSLGYVAFCSQVTSGSGQHPTALDPAIALGMQPVTSWQTRTAMRPSSPAGRFRFSSVSAAATKSKPIGAPYIADAKAYDPVVADKFYQARLPVVISRLAKLTSLTFGYNIRLLLDYWAYNRAGKPEDEPWPNEEDRAKEALGLATQLGPTFIKLAQALSIRTDLIPEAYALQLRELQDKVPSFDSKEAKEILAHELGVSDHPDGLKSIFKELSDEPLAAASIGQVYKGVLKDGRTVAVKVQRPAILDEIALDLYLLRLLAPIQTRVSNFINKQKTYPEDIKLGQELVDEWGRGFVQEADYLCESANSKRFAEAMKRRGLGAVTSPSVVDELTTRKVLVTEWVDGTRLDLDASPDVPRLCGVAINSYLTMLLDTGVLHCDPHPGNLLRTRDGKLCILDWGMTLAVPSDLQYSLIEFIAHVNAEDFEAMPKDFVNLGFSPPNALDKLKASNLTEGLSFALRQLSQGGGGKKLRERVRSEWMQKYDPEGKLSKEELRAKVRAEFYQKAREQLAAEGVEGASVMDVQNLMEKMSQRNRELFKVPPYILYVARAFSTLEGIGLSANEDYSIVKEAFPYLSKRLLTDNSPRAKAALRSMVYGSKDKDASNSVLNITKMLNIGEGFQSYSSQTSGVPEEDKNALSLTKATTNHVAPAKTAMSIEAATDDLLDVLLSSNGNYVQELLLEEAAKLADATVRDSIAQVGSAAPINALADVLRAPKQIAESTVLQWELPDVVKSAINATLLPARVLDDVSRVVPALARADKTDQETLFQFSKLQEQIDKRLARSPDSANSAGAPKVEDNVQRTLASVQENAGPLLEQLTDSQSRLRQRLPLLGAVSSRFWTTLLRRVADRLEEDANRPDSPGLAREVATRTSETYRNLASFIDEQQGREQEVPVGAGKA
eukprot:gnl/MRDRNA2_/MRDRNA2_168700_c0_seq1.p1 gnl/MRDRNA2_/MRDRNA2_168700_c0~~gnl/MRDRNA2_/MRDRNA2_168700_c0_seq1.p1  ORF type:complete len:946 (+),score=191.60 gnl/MRDRNA2_/MRDRNA2_168700_c0_seq1:80-2917(+)